MARRIIVCDGAETARLWSRIGAADNEELTWVPREDESRARPSGFRILQGGLTADAFRKLDPEPGDEYALATDDGPWIRAAVPAISEISPEAPSTEFRGGAEVASGVCLPSGAPSAS